MEEELSKFPEEKKKRKKKKKKKKELDRQSKCHTFLKQVCFSYGESPRTPPFEGTSLHQTLGDLEPVYDLFTIKGEIITSESLSRVTYTGINSMHSQKTKQPYIWSARKNRTRKKIEVEQDPRKSPEKNKKDEPFE